MKLQINITIYYTKYFVYFVVIKEFQTMVIKYFEYG